MPRINSINFYQNRPKIKILAKKNKKILSAEGSAPTPHASSGWGPCPQTPIASGGWGICPQTLATPLLPPIADFWLRACMKKNLLHVTAGLH